MKNLHFRAQFFKNNFWVFLLIAGNLMYAQDSPPCVPVILDGFTTEWPSLEKTTDASAMVATCLDAQDDGRDIDITAIQVTNDENNIYFRIVFKEAYPLGENNSLFLELDTDNNPATGYRINGIGCELGWQFGQRVGYYKDSETADYTPHKNLGFTFVPPFTAREYEVALSLNAEPRPGKKLFLSDTIKVLLWDRMEGGDLVPEMGKQFTYIIQRNCHNSVVLPKIKPRQEDAFRVLSWNTYNSGITESTRSQDIQKVLRLVNPDIISFIECWRTTAREVDSILKIILPGKWFVKKYGEGVILASRFKIKDVIPVNIGANENIVGFKLQIGKEELMFFSCHLSCCYFDAERIIETQALMAIINKEATFRDGTLKMPVILAGDFNIVGSAIPYENLTKGRLHLSQKPILCDLVPLQTDHPSTITWRDYQTIFSPARLDYIFYSPVNLLPIHSFILNTHYLSSETLLEIGLDSKIMSRCSDHLPLVADFQIVRKK